MSLVACRWCSRLVSYVDFLPAIVFGTKNALFSMLLCSHSDHKNILDSLLPMLFELRSFASLRIRLAHNTSACLYYDNLPENTDRNTCIAPDICFSYNRNIVHRLT